MPSTAPGNDRYTSGRPLWDVGMMNGMDSRLHDSVVRFATLARRLLTTRPSCGTVRVVAVDGPGASGKTTFTGRLAGTLGSMLDGSIPVVHSDEFTVPWDDPLAWWWPMREQVLDPLSNGLPGRFLRYDWRSARHSDWTTIPVMPVVIVDGVGAAWLGAVDRLSYTIWVEAPADLRRERAIRRDGPAILADWIRWVAAEDAHFAADGTRERADLLVDGAPTVPYDPEREFAALRRC